MTEDEISEAAERVRQRRLDRENNLQPDEPEELRWDQFDEAVENYIRSIPETFVDGVLGDRSEDVEPTP